MDGNADKPPGLLAQAIGLVERAQKAAAKPSVRPWLLLLAAVVFVAMTYMSFRSLPDDSRSANPWVVLLIVLLAAPATLVLNAIEYRVMAAALGHRIGVRSAAKVSLAATLANYLPAPGGVAVRTAALKVRGSSIGAAVSINAVAGLMWLGVAALCAGVALVVSSDIPGRGALAIGLGVVALTGAAVWMRRGNPHRGRAFVPLLLIETGIVLVVGFRIWIALIAIGQTASLGAALAISSSSVIAAAVGIMPAGLGLREAIGGGLAVAVDVPVASAVAAMAVDRVCGQVGMLLCTPFVGLRRLTRNGRAGGTGGADGTDPGSDAEPPGVPPDPDNGTTAPIPSGLHTE